jgi:hypothetical protein
MGAADSLRHLTSGKDYTHAHFQCVFFLLPPLILDTWQLEHVSFRAEGGEAKLGGTQPQGAAPLAAKRSGVAAGAAAFRCECRNNPFRAAVRMWPRESITPLSRKQAPRESAIVSRILSLTFSGRYPSASGRSALGSGVGATFEGRVQDQCQILRDRVRSALRSRGRNCWHVPAAVPEARGSVRA